MSMVRSIINKYFIIKFDVVSMLMLLSIKVGPTYSTDQKYLYYNKRFMLYVHMMSPQGLACP